ncbi:MAG TPA: LysR substrate-binding domain-containing protein [Candidatus Angelobacter sp.]|jgi:DNA-binding transcriptional LysR family regulator
MELRHLLYFTAVVERNGYREASRHLHIAHPSISQTVADLEQELGLKLFSRAGRKVALTPEGEAFYVEAVRTLKQAESAINTAKRAAKGEVGKLSIGFIGSATYAFLPLVRSYKAQYPGVKVTLHELTPLEQETVLDQRTIDIAFTRTLAAEKDSTLSLRCLYPEPLLAVLPASRRIKGKSVHIADLAGERFVVIDRKESGVLFDTILRICNEAGFTPRIENEPDRPQTVLSLVEAGQGVFHCACLCQEYVVERRAILPLETGRYEHLACSGMEEGNPVARASCFSGSGECERSPNPEEGRASLKDSPRATSQSARRRSPAATSHVVPPD